MVTYAKIEDVLESVIYILRYRVRARVTLRMASYRQSVRLGAKPLEFHNQRFFAAVEHLRSQSSRNFCGERMALSLMSRLHLCLVYVSYI
jgi:hypothetical protein